MRQFQSIVVGTCGSSRFTTFHVHDSPYLTHSFPGTWSTQWMIATVKMERSPLPRTAGRPGPQQPREPEDGFELTLDCLSPESPLRPGTGRGPGFQKATNHPMCVKLRAVSRGARS